jgi:hypothetical protein
MSPHVGGNFFNFAMISAWPLGSWAECKAPCRSKNDALDSEGLDYALAHRLLQSLW